MYIFPQGSLVILLRDIFVLKIFIIGEIGLMRI